MITINETIETPSELAALVAPEDIAVGDFVCHMNDIRQFVISTNCGGTPWDKSPRLEAVTVKTVCTFPSVMRVLSIALPFLLVEDEEGSKSVESVRNAEFARLPQGFGRIAMDDLRKKRRQELRDKKARRAQRRAARDKPGAINEGAD